MADLFATVLDLSLEGSPDAALSRVVAEKSAGLRTASGIAASYLRGRYTLPLVALPQVPDYVPVTGSTATGQMTAAGANTGTPALLAYGLVVEILSSGSLGAATARLSTDGEVSWGAAFTLTNTLTPAGTDTTLTFSAGTYVDGDKYRCSVSYGALTTHVVALAVYRLLGRRGWAPQGLGADPIRDNYKEALKWLEGVRDLKADPGLLEGAGGTGSDMIQTEPSEIDESVELAPDRTWQGVMGLWPAGSSS